MISFKSSFLGQNSHILIFFATSLTTISDVFLSLPSTRKCAKYDKNSAKFQSYFCEDELCPICEIKSPVKFQLIMGDNKPDETKIDNHFIMINTTYFEGRADTTENSRKFS